MDSGHQGATPIGWTELLAATVATLFAVAAAWGLLTVIATSPHDAASRPQAYLAGLQRPPTAANDCASGPVLGGLRLGTSRLYGQAGVRLDPVPLTVIPAISAEEAWRRTALKPTGCQTEELLAYYSGGDPPAQGVLAWAVVSASACGSRRCVTVSPVDATSGRPLPTGVFAVDPGK